MTTCASCKWWSRTWLDYDEPVKAQMWSPDTDAGRGAALHTGPPDYDDVMAPGEWGQCRKVAEFGPRSASDRFYVVDGSTYLAWLQTRNDFGCVEHEAGDA